MAKKIEYNSILTEREFTDSDRFKRARKAREICDACGRIIGSVSDNGVYDLFGNGIADADKAETVIGADGNNVRKVEYSSENRTFILKGDDLYESVGREKYIGRIVRRQRNAFRIAALGMFAVILAVIIAIIALIDIRSSGESSGLIPVIDVSDASGPWSTQSVIAVFGDGHKIKPGSSGKYEFVINNTNEKEIRYGFSIEPKYEGCEISEFPIKFRLRMNNVVLETDAWRPVEELVFDDMVILPQTQHSFTLEWNWLFDGGSDDNDTLIGTDGGKISMVLQLTAQEK